MNSFTSRQTSQLSRFVLILGSFGKFDLIKVFITWSRYGIILLVFLVRTGTAVPYITVADLQVRSPTVLILRLEYVLVRYS